MCVVLQSAAPETFNEARAAHVLSLLDELELKRTRRPANSDWARMMRRRRTYTAKLVDDLKRGNLSLNEFERYFEDGLRRTHINAAVMGRQRAGDFADESEADEVFGIVRAGNDNPYLSRFISDLRNGRYGPIRDLDQTQVTRRALYYCDKARSTANESFVLASSQESVFEWTLMGTENHCSTCPEKAANGPYDARSLSIIGYPASGRDACRTNCLCVVVRQDNIVGFPRVNYGGSVPASQPARELVSA